MQEKTKVNDVITLKFLKFMKLTFFYELEKFKIFTFFIMYMWHSTFRYTRPPLGDFGDMRGRAPPGTPRHITMWPGVKNTP